MSETILTQMMRTILKIIYLSKLWLHVLEGRAKHYNYYYYYLLYVL